MEAFVSCLEQCSGVHWLVVVGVPVLLYVASTAISFVPLDLKHGGFPTGAFLHALAGNIGKVLAARRNRGDESVAPFRGT